MLYRKPYRWTWIIIRPKKRTRFCLWARRLWSWGCTEHRPVCSPLKLCLLVPLSSSPSHGPSRPDLSLTLPHKPTSGDPHLSSAPPRRHSHPPRVRLLVLVPGAGRQLLYGGLVSYLLPSVSLVRAWALQWQGQCFLLFLKVFPRCQHSDWYKGGAKKILACWFLGGHFLQGFLFIWWKGRFLLHVSTRILVWLL